MKTLAGDFNTFAQHYKPLRFKFMGLPCKERLPYSTQWLLPFALGYVRLRAIMGLKLSYFDLRLSLTPEHRKRGDLMFLTVFAKKHVRGTREWPRMQRIHYWLLQQRYYPELMYIKRILSDPRAPKHPDQPKVDAYLIRWGYLLDVEPSFEELIAGTAPEAALYVLDNIA